MPLTRRGFSLAELLVALTATAGLAVLAWGVFARAAARLRDRSERAGLAHALRTAGVALRAGFEDLGADSLAGADLYAHGAGLARYRATRMTGFVCAVVPPRLLIRRSAVSGGARREPVPGKDSAMVLTVRDPPHWLVAPILAQGGAACPDGSSALSVSSSLDSLSLSWVGPGSAIRIFEVLEARRYASGSLEWLGLQSISAVEPVQPLAGPLGAGGLQLDAERMDGAAAANPAEAGAFRMVVRGATHRELGLGLMRQAAAAVDSVRGYVLFRNRR